MQAPQYFEQIGTRGFYRPVGSATFEQVIELVAGAMRHARSLRLNELLASSHGLTGMSPPSTFQRYNLAVSLAEAGGGELRLALVTRPEVIDYQKIGTVMSQNRGLDTDVFTSEADAIRWLNARAGIRP
jgi:hypothetical protein